MADYSSLSTSELINLLNEKDEELQIKENEITSLENKLTKDTVYNGADASIDTANTLITRIISLSETEQKSLPSLVRTTENGIKAYTIFLYGAATGIDYANEDVVEEVIEEVLQR